MREQLAKILQIIEAKENEIYDRLINEFGIANISKHGQQGVFDLLGLSAGEPSFNNLTLVEAAIHNNHQAADQLFILKNSLHAYQGVKHQIYSVETDLKEAFANHVAQGEEDTLARDEHRQFEAAKQSYEKNFARQDVADSAQGEYNEFVASIKKIAEGQAQGVIELFKLYEEAYSERQKIYSTYSQGTTTEGMQAFRTELLQHLAGSIVVKEHRLRYQKEQFDRFISSLQCNRLFKRDLNLREFCIEYSYLIESLIEDSNNDRSPKIEANYDDFGERTVRPINATIFYYFFSADRRKRTIA